MRHASYGYVLDTEKAQRLFSVDMHSYRIDFYKQASLFFTAERHYKISGQEHRTAENELPLKFGKRLSGSSVFNAAIEHDQLTPEIEAVCDLREPPERGRVPV